MEIGHVLNERMQAIKDASTDKEVFKHIHAYIKYVLTTPELKSILDDAEKDFYKKVQFTEDNIKLEHSNFYQSYFVTSYVRIYAPIEEYWNSDEPDEQQDPLALLLIWGMNHPRTKKWINGHEYFPKSEQIKTLKSYWRWFDGQTQYYVNEIKNLHLELLTALSKQQTVKLSERPDLSLTLNLVNGDFHLGDLSGTFNTVTQEFRVLAKLYMSKDYRVPYLELIQCIRSGTERVTKPDKADLAVVIRNIKEQLGILPVAKRINQDIFKNDPQFGYRLISKT